MNIEIIIEHEKKRMDALMHAFDEACGDNIGFGHHSTAVVALLGFARVLMQLRAQFANLPHCADDDTRQWAASQVAYLDDLAERLDAKATFQAIMTSIIRERSVPLTSFANAVAMNLVEREWIALCDDEEISALYGLGRT